MLLLWNRWITYRRYSWTIRALLYPMSASQLVDVYEVSCGFFALIKIEKTLTAPLALHRNYIFCLDSHGLMSLGSNSVAFCYTVVRARPRIRMHLSICVAWAGSAVYSCSVNCVLLFSNQLRPPHVSPIITPPDPDPKAEALFPRLSE